MSIPFPESGRPDQSVNTDSGTQLTQGFQVLSRQLQTLERTIAAQTAMLSRTLSAGSRYQMSSGHARGGRGGGGGGYAQQERNTPITPMGAVSSLENLQAYGAQQLGQWIAGTPLYEMPSGTEQGGGSGGTPAGTPTSAGRPPGGGAPPPGGPASGSGGGGGGGVGPPGGTGAPPGGGGAGGGGAGGGGGGGRQGLPGAIWGPGSRGGSQTGTAVLQQIGTRVAATGGTLSGIGSELRKIPGVGLVSDIVSGAANTYLNQREAARPYQEVEGGSNLSAQTERLHAAVYQASMYGRMPSGAAAQAFGAVTALGYNQAASGEGQQQQNRQSALNFVYHNYTANGMDVNQSLGLLQTASGDANVNLSQLSSTLTELSTAAGQAGANAETARQQFSSYFATALGNGAGNGATGVAGGISAMQASMGKEFSNVNFSGELSQGRQYLLSGQSGLSAPQLQDIQRTNPGAYNSLLAGSNMQILSQGGLMTPQLQKSLNSMIAAAGGGKALVKNPDLRDQIATQFLNQNQVSSNINESLWAQEISSLTGVQMDPTKAFQWIVSQSAGINEASNNKSLGIAGNPGASVSAKKPGSTPTGQYGLAKSSGANALEKFFTFGNMGQGSTWQQVLQKDNGPAANAYLSQEAKSGQRSPVLESLLQNTSAGDQVSVQTSKGSRVMSIQDAMKNYPNELAAGSVEFYGANGQALGDTAGLTHGLVNASANVSAEEKQKAGANLGVSAAAYQKAHPASAPASGAQPVTVSLSAEAQQLLKLLPSNSDTAAASSQVPANPYVSQASR